MYSKEKPQKPCVKCRYKFEKIKEFYCAHPQSIEKYDVLTGLPTFTKCCIMRSPNHPCGIEGKLFKPKTIINYIYDFLDADSSSSHSLMC